jgi:hypothetical protein
METDIGLIDASTGGSLGPLSQACVSDVCKESRIAEVVRRKESSNEMASGDCGPKTLPSPPTRRGRRAYGCRTCICDSRCLHHE